eukprot:2441967-Rhodomonas_salina.2
MLSVVQVMRESQKAKKITEFLSAALTASVNITLGFGELHYFQHTIQNPYKASRFVKIRLDDPEVTLITDPKEWRDLHRMFDGSEQNVWCDLTSRVVWPGVRHGGRKKQRRPHAAARAREPRPERETPVQGALAQASGSRRRDGSERWVEGAARVDDRRDASTAGVEDRAGVVLVPERREGGGGSAGRFERDGAVPGVGD